MAIPKETVLFYQGDICRSILFIVEGRVRVYRHHENGQSVTLYYLEPGEQCNVNFTSALNSAPAVGTAECETEVIGYDIPVEYVAKLFLKEPVYQQYVFDIYVKRMEHMAHMIEDIRFSTLDDRLLAWLQKQKENPIKMTHEMIASHLGTSREVVSRLLKRFEKEGRIRLSRGMIERL